MPISHGYNTILGVGSESTFGTAVAATEKICFISETLTEKINEVLDNSLCGTPIRGIGRAGTKIIEGGFVYPWKTDLATIILSEFFGTYSTDTPSMGQNTFTLDNAIDGDGVTVAIDKQVSVYEFAGYKTSKLTISGTPTDGFRITSDGFAQSLSLSSVVNTSGVLAALGEPGTLLLFQDCVFRVGNLADALQASDAYSISEFTLEIDRGLAPVEVNSQTRTEAIENAFRVTTLKVKLPYYQTDFFVTAHRSHTQLQADLVITVGTSVFTIQMPLMTVTNYDNSVSGPEFVPMEVEFTLYPDPTELNEFIVLENIDTELQIIEEE